MTKKNLRTVAFWLCGVFALYGLVLAPLYQYLIANIVLSNTVWLDIVDVLLNHAELYGDVLLIGFVIGAVYRFGIRASRPLFLICGGAVLFKYFATILMISILYGALDLTGGLWAYLVAVLLELALGAAAVLITHIYKQHVLLPSLPRKKSEEAPAADPCLPFTKLFSLKNPLQASVFFSVLVLMTVRLLAFIIDFAAYGMVAEDIPLILVYSLLLILLPCAIGYFIALRCVSFIAK